MKSRVPLKLPVILLRLLRITTSIVYYFEVIYVEKGGIRIQKHFSTKFTQYTPTIRH